MSIVGRQRQNSVRGTYWLDNLFLLVLGSSILAAFYFSTLPRLSDHDEILYAVMGRNLATGRGLTSNLHHVIAVVKDGLPLADVHMPGHMILLGLSFWLLGQYEYAAFFASQAAYILSGLLLYWAGCRLANRRVGLFSAILFYLFPSFVAYANTAFSELTLTLLSMLFFVIWLKSLLNPKTHLMAWLALIFIAGMIHHETFLLFLPPILYSLWLWPKAERLSATLWFGLTAASLFGLIFLPLYLSRASYPHVLAEAGDLATTEALKRLITENLTVSLKAIFWYQDFTWQSVMWLQYLLPVVALLTLSRFTHTQKIVAGYVVFTFVGNFVGLTPLYPLRHWHSVRMFMHLVPPALMLVAVLIGQIKPSSRQYSVAVVILLLMGGLTISFNNGLVTRHQRELAGWSHFDQVMRRNLDRFTPSVIMLDGAFRYAWDYYPATVMYETESIRDIATLEKLFQTVPVEAIMVQEKKQVRDRDLLSTLALQEYLQAHGYKFLNKDDDYFIFVKQPAQREQ